MGLDAGGLGNADTDAKAIMSNMARDKEQRNMG
jgi:hypothetical protein